MADITLLYLIASGSIHVLTHILVSKAEHNDKERMIWGGKPINHDLEKALRRSFLSAQQAIAIDCQQKEKNNPWLKQRITEIANELKGCSPSKELSKEREQLFDSLDDLLALLTVNTQSAEELNQDKLKQQLVEFVLSGCKDVSDCYKAQIEARLFDEVRDYFIREIKQNEPVHNILMASSQAEVFAKINHLERGQEEIVKLLAELRDFKAATSWQAKMKLDIDLASDLFDDQILAVIKAMRQQGLRTLRIEAGSVIFTVEGSETAIRKLEQLTEIAGHRIDELTIISSHSPISLFRWIHKQFEEAILTGWKALDEVMGTAELAPAFRFKADKTQRAKEFTLGGSVACILIVQVEEIGDDVHVTLTARTKGGEILPIGLTLLVSQETGESQETQAKAGDNYLEQEWSFLRQEVFTVALSLGHDQVTEVFSL